MIIERFIFLSFIIAGITHYINAWSGHITTRRAFWYTERYRTCRTQFIFCWSKVTRYRDHYRTAYSCAPGWKHNGNQHCNIPICSPGCRNGGSCYLPNQCRCTTGYEGPICGGLSACSHTRPCYPGRCFGSNCACSYGFEGDSCLRLHNNHFKADVRRINATFTYHNPSKNQDIFRYMLDATYKMAGDVTWSNQGKFNYLEFNVLASIDTKYEFSRNPPIPDYIRYAKFGIVHANVDVIHRKLYRNGTSYVAKRKQRQCAGPSQVNPVANRLLRCYLNDTYIIQFNSGDRYILHFTIGTGGFRDLINSATRAFYRRDLYTPIESESTMELRLDYEDPVHCSEDNSCAIGDNVPLELHKDITRTKLSPKWSGWSDKLSGLFKYVFEVWKMEYSKDYGGLREPEITTTFNPVPLYIKKVDVNFTQFPTFLPKEPGVYSIILEVNDKANNSKYARRIAIFDQTSEISLSPIDKIFIKSASKNANYTWQTGSINIVDAAWENHFINEVHESGHFLSKILDYTPRLSEGEMGRRQNYKKILPAFDDNSGERNKSAIPNINSIVRFETRHRLLAPSGSYSPWTDVTPISENKRFHVSGARDGDSFEVQVRAHDIIGNTKMDDIVVHFDRSEPDVSRPKLFLNVDDGTYPFTSRMQILAKDPHSGVRKVSFRFVVNGTREVKAEKDFMIEPKTKEFCDLYIKDCYCVPMGECFKITTELDIDNCWLKVPMDKVADYVILVEVTVYNSAMLTTRKVETIGMVKNLKGIRQYFSPSNVTIVRTTDKSITIQWVQAPTCYDRAGIVIQLYTSDNKSTEIKVHKDATTQDITGLSPVTSYWFMMYTKYGNDTHYVTSIDPAILTFTTTAKEKGFPKGGVAGLVAGFMIVLIIVIVVLVFLGRTGRLQPAKQRMTAGIRTIRNTIRVRTTAGGYNNRAYASKEDDDIYFYGGMEMTQENACVISRKDISLESELTRGRFAVIFLAKYYSKTEVQTVVAKTLKDDQNKDTIIKMKAKINFYDKKVGHHKNVLHFIGSVDNDVRGPIMILEFCSKGVLKQFLETIRSNMTVDVEERLFRMVFGICLGMDYLASKQVVHRRLAARNILLNDLYEPKITGFGPEPDIEQDGEDKSGDERIPIKWMAPECMKTTRHANELSDVWSYGIVMWEIFSLGESPYPGLQSRDVPGKVKQGYKMKKPEYCDDTFYKLMLKCWHYDPRKRSGFAQFKTELNNMFSEGPGDEYYYRSNDL